MRVTSIDPFERAEAAFERGDFTGAREAYRELLLRHLTSGAQLTPPLIGALERMADIAVLFGEWTQAESFFARLRDVFRKSGNLYGVDYISLKSVSIAAARGRLRAARRILKELSARPEGVPGELEVAFRCEDFNRWEAAWQWPGRNTNDRPVFFASLYLEAGRIAAGEGQYERALALLKRGLAHSLSSKAAQQAETPIVLSMAAAHLERGDLLSASLALGLLPDAMSVARHPGYAVQELEIRARIDLLRGDLGPAKKKLERVLELCGAGGFEHAHAKAALNLAYVLIFLNQTAQAAALCRATGGTAVSRRDAATQARVEFLIRFAAERGHSLVSDVAIAYSVTEMQDDEAPAEKRNPSPVNQPFELPASPNFLTLFEERALGFFWHLGRCDWKAAESYLREMELMFTEAEPPTDSLIIHERLAALDCMLAYYKGDFESARTGFEKVIKIVRRLNFKPELWQLLRFLGWCHARLGDVAESERLAREISKLNRALADTLQGSDRVIYQLNKWTEAETYLAAEFNELARMKRAAQWIKGFGRLLRPWRRLSIMARLAALLDEADAYKADVMNRPEDGAAAPRRITPSKLSTLRRLLRHPRDRNTISFLVLPDRLLVARAGWLSLDFAIAGTSRLQLRELVSDYHRAVQADERAGAAAALKTLSSALQLPALLHTVPTRARALTFVLDDVLHGLPFAALSHDACAKPTDGVSPDAHRYLIEDYAVSVSYEWLPVARPPAPAGEVLAVSMPHGAPGIEPLPGADDERRQVLKWLEAGGVRPIEADAPDKREILCHLPDARFFHIACHGEFNPGAPSESALLIVSDKGEVERLSLRELSRLNLSRMELAVLSSCWSADNFVLPGRWIIGLSETFWRAGARAVLGSLWPLDDELTGQLMDKVYESLALGVSRDVALQQAQVACIRGQFGNEFRDPSYWAATVLHGETGPLRLNRSRAS